MPATADPQEVRTVPDPSSLTTDAIGRAGASERDYVDGQFDVLRERLRGIDTATALLNETVNRVPTDLQREVGHLRELTEERFSSVQTQFQERDTRQERESRAAEIRVDAAFSAQKESAREQNNSNTLAITKAQESTTETINKLEKLFTNATDALSKELAGLDRRLLRMESVKQGGKDTVTAIYAFAGFLVSLLVIGGFLAAAGAFSK